MENNFFKKTGKVAIGSRLRILTSKITEDAVKVYKLYGIDMKPKWFPVFYLLSENNEMTISVIATEIGHSQPSVSKIISEMSRKGLIEESRDKIDGRRNIIKLSKAGIEITKKIKDQYIDVNKAVEGVLAQTSNDLWKAIEEWEFLLSKKSFLKRVIEQRKERESSKVKIVNFKAKYQSAFKDLNKEWISTYFKMEEADYTALDNPKKYIIDNGGCVLMALYNEEPVGTCALIKMNDPVYDFELAKMAVAPKVHGISIGWLLGQAIIEKAKSLGASSIYLESNTILKPAISLYYKLGFQKIAGHPTPYERCNIQMELIFKK